MSDTEENTNNTHHLIIHRRGESNEDFKNDIGEPFVAMISPDTFERSFSFQYGELKLAKDKSTEGKHTSTDPVTYNFTLVLDGTGIVGENYTDVNAQLKALMAVLFYSDDEFGKYTPHHVSISYCGDDFDCTVTSFKISYTLFNKEGKPLRAKVSCGFKSKHLKTPEEEEAKNEQEKPSPESIKVVLEVAIKNDEDSMIKCFTNLNA